MKDPLQTMIDSAVRMSLETLRLQQQLQVLDLTRQIRALESEVSRLQQALVS